MCGKKYIKTEIYDIIFTVFWIKCGVVQQHGVRYVCCPIFLLSVFYGSRVHYTVHYHTGYFRTNMTHRDWECKNEKLIYTTTLMNSPIWLVRRSWLIIYNSSCDNSVGFKVHINAIILARYRFCSEITLIPRGLQYVVLYMLHTIQQ